MGPWQGPAVLSFSNKAWASSETQGQIVGTIKGEVEEREKKAISLAFTLPPNPLPVSTPAMRGTILGKINGKPWPSLPPKSKMVKWRVFALRAASSLICGDGSSLVPRPVCANRVTRGGLEPSARIFPWRHIRNRRGRLGTRLGWLCQFILSKCPVSKIVNFSPTHNLGGRDLCGSEVGPEDACHKWSPTRALIRGELSQALPELHLHSIVHLKYFFGAFCYTSHGSHFWDCGKMEQIYQIWDT